VKKRFKRFANAVEQNRWVGVANEVTLSTDGWAVVSPYGDFPHAAGMQRVTKESAERIVKDFKSFWGRIKRAIVGLPIFRGHPDCPSLANQYPDKAAYGMFADLEAREDGLYGRPVLNSTGADLVERDGLRFLSPYWEVMEIANENGRPVYSPVKLLSVGLTSKPNIPGPSLTNDTSKDDMDRKTVIALLGLPNEATDEQITAAIAALKESAGKAVTLENEKKTSTVDLAKSKQDLELAQKQAGDIKINFANERSARIDLLVSAAEKDGRITPAEADGWKTALANESTFDAKAKELAELKAKMHTQAVTGNVGDRKVSAANARELTDKLVALTNEHMQKHGVGWDDAWRAVKTQHPDLFK
jgi:hypothetical protein